MNILLVDDEWTTMNILLQVINWKEAGIDSVFCARNAQEAKKALSEKDIQITLCDIEMPKESGLDLIEWIQGLYPSIINIILTGHADFNYARSAISLGVFSYLLKPVEFEEIQRVVAQAVQRVREDRKASSAFQTGQGREDDIVRAAKAYIEAHYNETITRNDIEQNFHMSSDHINREFKKIYGFTLMEYVQHIRIDRAKEYLRGTGMSIQQISQEVGYNSQAYFGKVFKKMEGNTPLEYKNAVTVKQHT